MALTIYVVGHLDSAVAVLNAVAMVFGSGLFADSTQFGFGSVLYLALMVGFSIMLYNIMTNPSTFGGKNGPVQFVGSMLILWAVTGPTTTVQVESLSGGGSSIPNTANLSATQISLTRTQSNSLIATVANVPIGIAFPAAMISAFTREIGTRMETAFSTLSSSVNTEAVDTSMFSATATGEPQGFIDPLRILGNFPAAMLSVDPYWNKSFLTAYRDCMTWNSKKEEMLKSGDVLGWLHTNAPGGITTYYAPPPANPDPAYVSDGSVMSCKGAFAKLKTDLSNSVEKTSGTSGQNKYDNTKFSKALSMYHSTNAQNIQNAMRFLPFANDANAVHTYLSSPMIGVATRCGNQMASLNTYQDCAQIMIDDARRVYQAHAAAESTLFQQMLLPAMGMLQLIFFALAPLVIIVAAFAPSQMVSLLAKYVFFGLWTQSWLPVAVIINFLVQIDIVREIAAIYATYGNVSVETAGPMMHAVGRKIIVASNLMSSVPLITMAVFTGSYFALSGMAQRFMGSTAGSEVNTGLVARQTASVAPGVGIQADAQFSEGGGLSYTGRTAPSIDVGSTSSQMISSKIGAARTVADGKTSELATALSHAAKSSITQQNAAQVSNGYETAFGGTHIKGFDDIKQFGKTKGLSEETTAQMQNVYDRTIQGALEGRISWDAAGSILGKAIKGATGVGASVGARGTYSISDKDSETQSFADKLVKATQEVATQNTSEKDMFTRSWKDASTKANSSTNTHAVAAENAQQDQQRIARSMQEVNQASSALEKLQSLQQSLGVKGQVSATELGQVALRSLPEAQGSGHHFQNMVLSSGNAAWAASYGQHLKAFESIMDKNQAMAAAAVFSAAQHGGSDERAWGLFNQVFGNATGMDVPRSNTNQLASDGRAMEQRANDKLNTSVAPNTDWNRVEANVAQAQNANYASPGRASMPSGANGKPIGGNGGQQGPVPGSLAQSPPALGGVTQTDRDVNINRVKPRAIEGSRKVHTPDQMNRIGDDQQAQAAVKKTLDEMTSLRKDAETQVWNPENPNRKK